MVEKQKSNKFDNFFSFLDLTYDHILEEYRKMEVKPKDDEEYLRADYLKTYL